jgi:ribosomal-protein-alanine N-acetyltransferase
MELNTPRLRLREFRLDDYSTVHAFASDSEVVRHADWGPNDPHDTERFLRDVADSAVAAPRSVFALAMVERSREAVVGSVQLAVASAQHRRGEMGYVLARAQWGRGYATEASAALLRFGFENLGLHKISATCAPANIASVRVLTKIGMRPEGYLHEHLYVRGRWQDRLLFAALSPGQQETG